MSEWRVALLQALRGSWRIELARWGVYDEPEDTDPYWRARIARQMRAERIWHGVPWESKDDEFERHIRHADLLDKWPADDWWRGA